MIKNLKINIMFLLLSNLLFSDLLGPDVAFIDLPINAKSASLGNTYLSDVGAPANLLLNPANIWFGNEINISKGKPFWNVKPRFSISNFSIVEDDNNFNIMSNIQFSNKLTLGFGYLQNLQAGIEEYNEDAIYLGEIEYIQNMSIVGLASSFYGVNFGSSIGRIDNNFYFENNPDISDQILFSSVGLSMNDKFLLTKRDFDKPIYEFLSYLLPYKLSFHINSRNIYHYSFEGDIEIAKSSLYKNILGCKLDYQVHTNRSNSSYLIFMFDYSSNNNVTDNVLGFGLSYEFIFQKVNSINLNLGFNNVSILEEFSYGIEYRNKKADFSFSLANVLTPWNSNYNVMTISYYFPK